MRIAKRPAELGFTPYDVSRLPKALKRATEARLLQRVQAVLWVAQGETISAVAALTGVSGQTGYNWRQRSLPCQQVAAWVEAPRSGRPVTAPQMTATKILRHLHGNPLHLGYRTTGWSVTLLAAHLSHQEDGPSSPHPLRRRMKALGLRCNGPAIFLRRKPRTGRKKRRESPPAPAVPSPDGAPRGG
jgi:transposase